MRKTLEVLNDLEKHGFFIRYAIGGAVAVLFYMEPSDTIDLDIFIIIDAAPLDLDPFSKLNAELKLRGYQKQGMYDLIEGTPVQFLPAEPALIKEAVAEANDVDYEGVNTRVPTAEHLVAIMVSTGRIKDQARVLQMVEDVTLDEPKLVQILTRFGLLEKYKTWTI